MTRLANPSDDATYVEDAHCIQETAKAIRVEAAGSMVWIPKSCLHDDSEVTGDGDHGTIAVKTWWCEKNGWPE